MTACISSGGGGAAAAYSFELEKVKSPPSSSTTTTRATSPSSTISESSNSPLAISTRKPRTQRKRPNQTYNEAAALLSSAYPNIFSSNLSTSSKQKKTSSNSHHLYGTTNVKSPLLSDTDDSSDLLLPYESIEEPDFLFHHHHHPTIQSKSEFFSSSELKEVNSGGGGSYVYQIEKLDFSDEFDAESILDEEIEEGIDSIMGTVVESNSNLGIYESRVPANNRGGGRSSNRIGKLEQQLMMINSWNRSSSNNGFKLPLGLGLKGALRENHDPNLYKFHTVDFEQISPRIQTETAIAVATVDDDEKKSIGGGEKSKKTTTKKKKKMAALVTESKSSSAEETITTTTTTTAEEETTRSCEKRTTTGPLLKLDYDGVLEAWSDKTSPFPDDILGTEAATGIDVNARLAQIDLFGDSGMREASVLRYKEKRRTRLFSKKIRYQVRKLNADQRPRMKGRFVRRPNESTPSGQR
ncbi:PREDICTED: protein CHLOROPLAST IMPORT APPARATUS 2-like [Camelina sativa]|uniref:Protein CHLOROPLAST IMPORT APPARATUS 2-like n=1 Tax=Camelina sativa TaxID=90675 RepID=A0ABM1QNW9_CAMSA|nr:PREDICTED: protein CHLOROPLAST IMPORT APPARATUS 2-like [Camelina sativa]